MPTYTAIYIKSFTYTIVDSTGSHFCHERIIDWSIDRANYMIRSSEWKMEELCHPHTYKRWISFSSPIGFSYSHAYSANKFNQANFMLISLYIITTNKRKRTQIASAPHALSTHFVAFMLARARLIQCRTCKWSIKSCNRLDSFLWNCIYSLLRYLQNWIKHVHFCMGFRTTCCNIYFLFCF